MRYFFDKYDIGQAIDNSPQAFASAIRAYFYDDKLAQRVGQQGRKVAEQVLAWDRLSGKLERFYMQMKENIT